MLVMPTSTCPPATCADNAGGLADIDRGDMQRAAEADGESEGYRGRIGAEPITHVGHGLGGGIDPGEVALIGVEQLHQRRHVLVQIRSV